MGRPLSFYCMGIRQLKPTLRQIDARAVKPKPKVVDDFYTSPEWRGFMDMLFKKRGRICEECGRSGTRLFGDHIHELKDGGAPLDEENVLIRCGSCHTRKTLRVRAERMAKRY